MGVDELLSEGVLVVVVDEEVGGESVSQEGVVVLEDDFDCIFSVLLEIVAGQLNAALTVLYLLRLQPPPVHLREFNTCPAEIQSESLTISQAVQNERDVHDALIVVAFHQT